jgi:vacuolar-type H+-ATPase subunit H
MDILYLVDRLENLLASSRRMPLVNSIMIKEADILNIVDSMRTSIPDEIKQARRIIQEKERILAQAQADANALLTRAREESERAMNREGLLRIAEERSEEMVRMAEEKAEQLKNEADGYVVETLRALRDHLTSIETEIGRSVLSIEKGLSSLESSGGAERGEDDNYADYEDGEDGREPVRDQEGMRPVPRRASLAADTMGGPMYMQEVSWADDGNESDDYMDAEQDARNASVKRGPGFDSRA